MCGWLIADSPGALTVAFLGPDDHTDLVAGRGTLSGCGYASAPGAYAIGKCAAGGDWSEAPESKQGPPCVRHKCRNRNHGASAMDFFEEFPPAGEHKGLVSYGSSSPDVPP